MIKINYLKIVNLNNDLLATYQRGHPTETFPHYQTIAKFTGLFWCIGEAHPWTILAKECPKNFVFTNDELNLDEALNLLTNEQGFAFIGLRSLLFGDRPETVIIESFLPSDD